MVVVLRIKIQSRDENSPNVAGGERDRCCCRHTLGKKGAASPPPRSGGQGLALLVVHRAEGLLLWESPCRLQVIRGPTGKGWHAVRALDPGAEGRGRHIAVPGFFANAAEAE